MKECPVTKSSCTDIDCNEQCMLEAIAMELLEPEAPKLDNSEIGLVLSAGATTALEEYQNGEATPLTELIDEPEPKPSLNVPGHILNN